MSLQSWLDETSRTNSVLNGVVPSLRRRRFIETYQFPDALRARFAREYSHLSPEQCELVWRALRQYFLVCALSGRQMTAMSSRLTDDAWHNFILFTRDYENFCRQAFGHYLHHTPAEAMKAAPLVGTAQPSAVSPLRSGLKLTWRLACRVEGIDPILADRLPLLFAVDAMLGAPDAPHYDAPHYDARQMALFARTGSTVAATNKGACGGSWCGGYSAGSCFDGGSGDGCGDGSGGDSGGDGGCGGGCGGGD